MSQPIPTLQWHGDIDGHLVLLDQTKLPGSIEFLECTTSTKCGSPSRNFASAAPRPSASRRRMACVLGAQAAVECDLADMQRRIAQVCDYLATSRPTAVNLFWALDRMRKRVRASGSDIADRTCRNTPRRSPRDPRRRRRDVRRDRPARRRLARRLADGRRHSHPLQRRRTGHRRRWHGALRDLRTRPPRPSSRTCGSTKPARCCKAPGSRRWNSCSAKSTARSSATTWPPM